MLLTFRPSARMRVMTVLVPGAVASTALHPAVDAAVAVAAFLLFLALSIVAFRSYEVRKSAGIFTLTSRLFGATIFAETSNERAPFAAFQRKTKKRPNAGDPWTVSFRGARQMRVLPFTMNADRALAMVRILHRLPEGTVRGIAWPF